MSTREALMHLDGCHFYAWVYRDYDASTVLAFAERDGDNLSLHGAFGSDGDEDCQRCRALRNGAEARYVERHIDPLPEDAKESFFTVVGLVGEIDEEPVA